MTLIPDAVASCTAEEPTDDEAPQTRMVLLVGIELIVGIGSPRQSLRKRPYAAVEIESGRTTACS